MPGQPRISIIIPAYNAAAYIERTLRSAIGQTYPDTEIIVVDDGSTDETEAIVQATSSGYPHVRIIKVSNGGVARARNIGTEAASGQYVAFLDADDLWHPTKLEHQLRALESAETSGTAASYVLARSIDTEDRVIADRGAAVFSGYSFARHLYVKPVGNGSSLLVRREAALAVGGFEPRWAAQGIGGCEDLDFELKIAARYAVSAVPLYLVGYRISPGSMSSHRLRMARAALATVEHHTQACPDLPKWAARSALAEVSVFAFNNLKEERRWKLAGEVLARLFWADPGKGLEISGQIVGRKLALLTSLGKGDASGEQRRPSFYELSPEFGVSESLRAYPSRDMAIIRRLESIDAAMAKRSGIQV